MSGWDNSAWRFLEAIDALLANDLLFDLGDKIPTPPPEHGGRPRHYPAYAVFLYNALLSVYRSSRRVETELAYAAIWAYIRTEVRRRFPARPDMWLPEMPMQRHHYDYMRDRYLVDDGIWAEVAALFRLVAAEQAAKIKLCRPDGPGSLTHPDLSRVLYADGKVVTPLFKTKPGARKLDKRTGELRQLRCDPTSKLHVTGSGEEAWGNKFVLVAARLPGTHGRMILDLDWVENAGGEARVATDAIKRVAKCLPGAQAVLYDGALRGTHIQELLTEAGVLPIAPVHALSGGRRARKERVEKEVAVETRLLPSGGTLHLYARAGQLGYRELTESGDRVFEPIPLAKITKTERKSDGTWRWYGEYLLPDALGGGTIRLRLDRTEEDDIRGFNRTEHLRPIPPGSTDYDRLYPRRSDMESINRFLDDTMWLSRAHSVGGRRQRVDVLGFALMVNSLALHRARGVAPPAIAA
jgi:hypothetical protein